MKRLILSVLVIISAIFLGGCVGPLAPPALLSPTQPEVTPKKITLADAPIVLDLSTLLPASFEHLDAASEGMSNKDLELGPEASEVELFLSSEPYQMIYGFIGIFERRTDQAALDVIFKDEQQIRNTLYWGLEQAAAEEGYELSEADMEIDITYPNIADLAVLGEGQFSMYGIDMGLDLVIFRNNQVYTYLYSVYSSSEKQSLIPLAKEIEHRISMFSQ